MSVRTVGLDLASRPSKFTTSLGAKAVERHGDPVRALPRLLDVIGRPVRPRRVIEHLEQSIEADRAATEQVQSAVFSRHTVSKQMTTTMAS